MKIWGCTTLAGNLISLYHEQFNLFYFQYNNRVLKNFTATYVTTYTNHIDCIPYTYKFLKDVIFTIFVGNLLSTKIKS